MTKNLVVLSLLTLFFNTIVAQEECSILMGPKIMGLDAARVEVDLDEVEVQTLPVVFHIVNTGS